MPNTKQFSFVAISTVSRLYFIQVDQMIYLLIIKNESQSQIFIDPSNIYTN